MFPSKNRREDKPRGVHVKKTTPKRKPTPTNFHKSVSLRSSRSWKVLGIHVWSPRRRRQSALQQLPPSLPCGFTLLIPEGPCVLHSWHSDLSPSSVTYYRRLLPPQSFHSERAPRQLVRLGDEHETRLTRTHGNRGNTLTIFCFLTDESENEDFVMMSA